MLLSRLSSCAIKSHYLLLLKTHRNTVASRKLFKHYFGFGKQVSVAFNRRLNFSFSALCTLATTTKVVNTGFMGLNWWYLVIPRQQCWFIIRFTRIFNFTLRLEASWL